MGHEVEAGHEEDEVDEYQPMFFEGDFAFAEEGRADPTSSFLPICPCCPSNRSMLFINLRLGQQQSQSDDDNRRTGAEPEEWSPAVGGGVY